MFPERRQTLTGRCRSVLAGQLTVVGIGCVVDGVEDGGGWVLFDAVVVVSSLATFVNSAPSEEHAETARERVPR